MAPPEASTLGHAVVRGRMRAALLGEQEVRVRVDRFALERELGRGGMGTVWLAHDEQLDRPLALKFLHKTSTGDAGEQRLFREAQGLAKLSHPNVIPVFDVGRHEGRVWIAMEYVAGRTLRAWAEGEPSPRARLSAWLAAGRGLAAVHRAGLVHRDVKPDNVLMGDDGRVRLVDFGLVRALPQTDEPATSLSEGQPWASRSGPADEGTTVPGQFVGTRAYAPPEQWRGLVVDARADQFSFCISVWEALCGERVSADRWPERADELVEVPQGARLSRRVRRALSRGLQVDPELRFPDMDALLAALEPRRGRWALGAAVAAGLAGVGLGLASAPSEVATPPCQHTSRPLDEHWTEARAQALRAEDPALADAIEAWAQDWRDAAQHTCEDVHVEQTRPESSLGPRRACLDASLDALAVVLSANDDDGAPRANVSIDPPSLCLSEALLSQGSEPPPEQREAVSSVRRELFAAQWGTKEPDLAARRAQAAELYARAQTLGHAPLVGRAAYVRASLALSAGDPVAAQRWYGTALDVAARHDPILLADAWNGLAIVALDFDLDARRAEWLLERNDEALAVLPDATIRHALARFERGRVHLLRGELEPAEQLMREAVAGFESAGPLAAWRHAAALRQLATVAHMRGHAPQVHELHARARELERHADPSQPTLDQGQTTLSEGLAQLGAGAFDEAEVTLMRAAEQLAEQYGPRSLQLAHAHVALSALYDARGRLGASRDHAALADQMAREAGGPDHPDRIQPLSALGTVAFREERFEDAAEDYGRAVTIAETRLPAGSVDLAWARSNLAEALHALGRDQRAETMLRQAIESLTRSLGPDHPDLAIPSKALGAVLRARGDLDGAREALERALGSFGESPDHLVERADTRWELAQTLEALGELTIALQLAEQARADFDSLGEDFDPRRQRVAGWIAEHQP